MEIFLEGLWHAVKDVLFLSPLLYLTYLLVCYFSHNDNKKYSKLLHRTKKAGPVVGAFLGCVPQCGFSSVMSNLYSRKIVTLGTLIAVFIATSDEAIPLMLKEPQFIPQLLILLAVKVVFAILMGYLIDGIIALFSRKKQIQREYHDKHCIEGEHHHLAEKVIAEEEDYQKHNETAISHVCEDEHEHKHCHHEEEGHQHCHDKCCATNIFLDALKHTLIVLAYVFVITLAINLVRGYCGGLEPLKAFFGENIFVQILLACVIGLIPNCASSVFLVELYLEGVLFFPALVAGLSAGAGVGILVLFTCNYKKVWQNICIVGILIVCAFAVGIITNFLPIW